MSGKDSRNRHFYGRRKLRPLHKGRTKALHVVEKEIMLAPDLLLEDQIDPQALCNQENIWLEIGFGNGEHLVQQALDHPAIGFIGCEAFINGVAAASKEIVEKGVENIKLWPDDALPLLAKIKPASLERIFLLFPDPWPKVRHYKRRFIQDFTVDLFASLLKPGGKLSLATDDGPLAEWMLLHVVGNSQFHWDNARNGDWRTPPDDWVETRYQQKAALQGRLAHYLSFTKN